MLLVTNIIQYLIGKVLIVVWNPKLAVVVAVISWAPCLLKKGSFYIINNPNDGFM